MLLQLNALAGFDLAALPTDRAERFALLIGAARAAFAEGQRHIADPRAAPAPVAELLGHTSTARLQEAIRSTAPAALAPNRGGTAIISVADAAGNGVTLIQSVCPRPLPPRPDQQATMSPPPPQRLIVAPCP